MKIFASYHPRVVAATPALSPALRRAAYPAGVSDEQLARFERDAGVSAAPVAKPAPASAPAANASKPAPAPHRAPPNAVRGASGGGAPIATATPAPTSPSMTPKASANPLFAAAAGAMAEFNNFHSSNRDDAND